MIVGVARFFVLVVFLVVPGFCEFVGHGVREESVVVLRGVVEFVLVDCDVFSEVGVA